MNISEFPPLHGQVVSESYGSGSGSIDITTFGILSGREVIEDVEERNFKEPDAEEAVKSLRRCFQVRPEFLYLLIYGIVFSDLRSGGTEIKKKKKALKMTS